MRLQGTHHTDQLALSIACLEWDWYAATPEGELVVVLHPVVARGIPMVGEE
jgi:hypothetical protein